MPISIVSSALVVIPVVAITVIVISGGCQRGIFFETVQLQLEREGSLSYFAILVHAGPWHRPRAART